MSAPAIRPPPELSPMELIDAVEARILALGGAEQKVGEHLPDFPVKHHFTPGIYAREILMKAGSVLTSKIHKTEHPFVVSQGKCLVYLNREDGWAAICAPHFGVTQPGTRRILVILEDTIWTTFHATDLTDPAEIERTIIEEYQNPLLVEAVS